MESESTNIIQMLKNVKGIIDVSRERKCWKDEELESIGVTYHNVCEIVKQLEERDNQMVKEECIDKDEMEKID